MPDARPESLRSGFICFREAEDGRDRHNIPQVDPSVCTRADHQLVMIAVVFYTPYPARGVNKIDCARKVAISELRRQRKQDFCRRQQPTAQTRLSFYVQNAP
jgi:hypothetical protein